MNDIQNELSKRLGILMSHSLAQVDINKLSDSDDQKWSLIAFMIGCVCGSRIPVESRQNRIDSVSSVLSEIFDWPIEASTKFVKEAFEDADKGACRVELEAGSQSMREFESATDRLKVLLEANEA